MRIVLDNNVVISAFLIQTSIPARVYRKVIHDHYLLISSEIEAELISKLKNQKFTRYFKDQFIREELIHSFLATCTEFMNNY